MQVDKEYLCKSNGTQAGPGLMNDNHNIENNNSVTSHPGAISAHLSAHLSLISVIQNSSEVSNLGQQSLKESQSQALKKPNPNG